VIRHHAQAWLESVVSDYFGSDWLEVRHGFPLCLSFVFCMKVLYKTVRYSVYSILQDFSIFSEIPISTVHSGVKSKHGKAIPSRSQYNWGHGKEETHWQDATVSLAGPGEIRSHPYRALGKARRVREA
jgi:hypothetical protein